MYSSLFQMSRLAFPGGMVKHRRLQELEKTQWLSPAELEAWQLKKIQHVVRYAYEHVPYYRQQYQRLGIHPEDVRSFKEFRALPFLTREDVNENLEAMVSPELRSKALQNSTGGSTGEPMQFYKEKAFSYWDNALELRGRGWYGAHEGDKIAWVWGAAGDMHTWDWKARLKAGLLRERYLNAFDMTEEKIRAFTEMLVKWKPVMFRAYASALTLLAQYIKDKGITGIRPKLIETTAEKITAPQRELLQEVFQCPVADWYTARELGTIGFQCPSGSLHVAETRYLEVIAHGQPAEPEELGEVVITSTHQFAMPLIRYRIGDMAISRPVSCPCGRGLHALQEVVGRVQDFLVTSDGRFVHGGYFPHTFRQWPEIFRYQVYQPDRKHLEVRFVCKQQVDHAWLDTVRTELRHRFGEDMDISVDIVDHFELTRAGKHRFIISDVKPDFAN